MSLLKKSMPARGLSFRLVPTLIVLACFARSGPAGEPVIHLLIVGETNDARIGKSVQIDVARIDEMFRGNVPERQLRIESLTGGEANPERWLAEIEQVRPAPDDTLVVYFAGHGAFDQNGGGHLFTPGGQRMRRQEVVNAMRKQGARLGVLLSDCCSDLIEVPIPIPFAEPVTEVTPLFDELFVKPRGFVDISATRPGETAVGTEFGGGVFTLALFVTCLENMQNRLNWAGVLTRVNTFARQLHPRQTAYAVSPLPGGAAAPAAPAPGPAGGAPRQVRLGVQGVDNAQGLRHGGVAISQVFPGMPATRLRLPGDGRIYHLVPGRDVITHVNGTPVRRNADLVAAVRASPPRIRLTILDLRTGATADYFAELQ